MPKSEEKICSRLLLIDDEPAIRKMMSLDLSADGYQVYTAADGESGLRVFKEKEPAIVLTDLKMPGLDGLEVLQLIKEQAPDTEVIVITGHGDMELAIKSLQLNASDFISKPINGEALQVALKRAQERLALKARLKAYTQDLEHQVSQATARVLASERLAAVGQTVSFLVHSLKNMLSGLKGGAYLIKEGLSGSKQESMHTGLEMLERNLRRVDRLVRDLLTLAKPRQPQLQPVEAQQILAEALEQMAGEAQAKEVKLRMDYSSPALIMADKEAILDGLSNLISNALHAAATRRQGLVEMKLEMGRWEMAFVVSDNGPGLDQEALNHIFEGFYSSKGAAGTGLGLMVAQKNACEHGGRVEYDNRPGKGVTFRLILPLTEAEGHTNGNEHQQGNSMEPGQGPVRANASENPSPHIS